MVRSEDERPRVRLLREELEAVLAALERAVRRSCASSCTSPFFITPRSVTRSFSVWLLFPPWSMRHIFPSVSTSLGARFMSDRLPRGVFAFFRIRFAVDEPGMGASKFGSIATTFDGERREKRRGAHARRADGSGGARCSSGRRRRVPPPLDRRVTPTS